MRSALDSISPPPPPPPPPPLQPSPPLPPPPPPHSSSYSPSLLIITAIVAFVIVTCAAIHILLRLLSRRPNPRSSSSPAFSPPPTPPALINRQPSANDRKALIDSLPLFSLSSSAPRLSGDCAVCLSRLGAHDELRMLPACAHAFHSPCIDAWLLSTPSCPLCRSPVRPPPPPDSDVGAVPVELGSVSDAAPEPAQHERRSYEAGPSFEEEVEAVVARLRRTSEARVRKEEGSAPAEEVAEAAGGGSRGWLRGYVDRLASSASSSFSSFRLSGRWSRRFESGDAEHSGRSGRRDSWDLDDDENGYSASFYRWLTGGAQA